MISDKKIQKAIAILESQAREYSYPKYGIVEPSTTDFRDFKLTISPQCV